MIGPVFSHESLKASRQPRFYVARTLFVAVLLGIVLSAWQFLVVSQDISNPGDMARFGEAVFALVASLFLTVCVLLSALLVAAAVSQEKDRKTLILLLLTDLHNRELVLGRLLASMLTVLVMIAASAPLLMMLTLLGGISPRQVAMVIAVTTVSSLAAGSLGSTLALWREKTFQALAMTALVIVMWLIGWEVVGGGLLGETIFGFASSDLSAVMSPWRAVQAAVEPTFGPLAGDAVADNAAAAIAPPMLVNGFLLAASTAVIVLNSIAIAMVRIWNPSREARPATDNAGQPTAAPGEEAESLTGAVQHAGGKVRPVWDNPILWREVRTWAYGKKILAVKFGYLVIFGLASAAALSASSESSASRAIIPPAAVTLAPMLVVSVILVNALSVTSLTNERDAKALDLLLATDLSPKELIFGKLGGAAYNAKEMILLPLLLCGWLWISEVLATQPFVFLVVGLLVVNAFAAVLGLHAGMMYPNSRHAIAASLGTLLFLFLGISTCMHMMLALGDSFEYQLAPFLGFVLGGGVGLFVVLGWRNPSPAMGLACCVAPFATFYAITSFLLGHYGSVFLATVATFGFGLTAMLVPALAEFDVATGRTTAKD